jgi:uncharacterized membrane protein (UPF0182 family)
MSTFPMPSPRPRLGLGWIIAALVVLLIFSRTLAGWFIDYLWWQEMGQVPTWIRMSTYEYGPGIVAWLVLFAVLWISHARGVKHSGGRLRDVPVYARLSTLALAFLALIVSLSTVSGWTVARFVGGTAAGTTVSGWKDPVFGKALGFYFFELPFFDMLLSFVVACAILGALVYYVAARAWQLKRDIPGFRFGQEFDLRDLKLLGSLESGVFKGLVAVALLGLAAKFWLGRYELLLSDHGNLMVGIDYVEQNIGLPLQMAKVAAAALAAVLILLGRRKLALSMAIVLVIDIVVPPLVSSLYVRPNELSLERPFIERHIQATRSAFGLETVAQPASTTPLDPTTAGPRAREVEFNAHREGRIDFAANKALLDNVRLWDWRAFHDTLSQSQPLRPYTYSDTDIDRYVIDGQLRQTLLAPRELDLNQLGDARNRWINRSLTFTHGYGFALAEANRITPAGMPVLLVQDAPVKVLTKSLKVTRPEIYFGETPSDTVFVRTSQPEYNYPSGSSEVNTRYEGRGGFPATSFGTRLMAALSEGDWNIVLTGALGSDSRMMIRRQISERLTALAPFLRWDEDPYMVSSQDGGLKWIIDGYLTSASHPYSRLLRMEDSGQFNYIRNSVKAVVDAYDGSVKLYVFDRTDPLVLAYEQLFPELFTPASAMPADLRAHTRSPELLFRAQAEIYRTYHMRDPESYYNRADLWDLATYSTEAGGRPVPVPPTYMIAELPGEKGPEFLLTIPFTPRNKQNLIGLMVARCDGEHLGELVFLQLPKQEVIQGPLQVEALINQDQNISKDLTLWNQQGSQVLRSQVLALPVDNTFLYVAPIYIQAAQARMPQLKKIALIQGDTLIYADTYEQALAQLEAVQQGKPVPVASPDSGTSAVTTSARPAPGAPAAGNDVRVEQVRMHLQRYRELASQGKWAEAGKELEAIESVVKR